MREFIRNRADACGLAPDRSFDACLIATEAVTNAIRHGRGPEDDGAPIEVRCGSEARGFFVEVGDRGRFIPATAAREDDVGGRGLTLIRRLTQRFELEAGDAGTRLRMLLGISDSRDRTASAV
jgi:anti-sigma regulatory factor (Ser/Thr protein kinase)